MIDRLAGIVERISSLYFPMSAEAKRKLASVLIRTDVKKNALFKAPGEVCDQICFVHKGMVRQFYYKNNKDLTEHFAYENAFFFCIESFFRSVPSEILVEALEPTVVYGIPHDPLLELVDQDLEIDRFYRSLLERSLIISQRKMDMVRFESANERYARLLKEDPEIIKRAPLAYIASYLLMTPETLSRVRAGEGRRGQEKKEVSEQDINKEE